MDLSGTPLPDTATHRNRRKILSETSSREYILSQRITTGVWECSCPGWTTHRKCKHLPVEETREHKMCVACQDIHHGSEPLTPTAGSVKFCCWCGKRTARVAPPDMELPCQDVHLEDVS